MRPSYRNYLKTNQAFDYLLDIAYYFAKGDNIPIDEINMFGGRYPGKTYHICNLASILMAIALQKNKKVAFYGFRAIGGKNIDNLQKEFQQALDKIGFIESDSKIELKDGDYLYNNRNYTPTWRFKNGSFIMLQGVKTSTNRAMSLKGLAGLNNFDLAISFEEEANEYTNMEFNAIKFAIRGMRKYIDIRASNPDDEHQDYVAYCVEHLTPNKFQLENYGQQMLLLRENDRNKIFHYTNYQVNPYLSESIVDNMLELKIIDPIQYDIWGLGMPGRLQEAIFARYLPDSYNDKNFNPTIFTGGVDIGQSDAPTGHPTAAIFTGFNNNYQFKPLAEYFHDNTKMSHKNPNQLAKDIVDFFITEGQKHYQCAHGLTIFVDYGAGGAAYIQIMKDIQNQYYPDSFSWLAFVPVRKEIYYIKDRIDITIGALLSRLFLIDPLLTPKLINQMSKMRYRKELNEREKHEIRIIDLDDDLWDALWYSIMTYIGTITEQIKFHNPLYMGMKGKENQNEMKKIQGYKHY